MSALGRRLFCTDFEKYRLGTVMATAIVAKDCTTLAFWQQGVLAVRWILGEAQSALFYDSVFQNQLYVLLTFQGVI